jgi:hypothetical protein
LLKAIMCNIFIGKALKMAIAKGHGGASIDEVINIIFAKAKVEYILVRNAAVGSEGVPDGGLSRDSPSSAFRYGYSCIFGKGLFDFDGP